MTLPAIGKLGLALVVFVMPVAAGAQGVAPEAQEGARQNVHPSKPGIKLRKQNAKSQNRVNSYFRDTVATPKLRECLSRVQGKGNIAIDFSYKRSRERWDFEKLAVKKSNLPAGQDEIALRCIQDSTSGTSFPAGKTSREEYAKALAVRWKWPIPLPPKGAKMTRIKSGGGGESGSEDCEDCVLQSDGKSKCVASDAGGLDCKSYDDQPNLCSWKSLCFGGVFGTSDWFFIYY